MPRKRKNERHDGRIQLRVDIGYDSSGKRLRKYFYGATRAEAERKKAEFLRNKTFISNLLLSEWIETYLSTYKAKVNKLYIQQQKAPYKRLERVLGARPITSIKELDLQQAMNDVQGMSYSTCSKYLQAIKAVFRKARKNGLIPEDPAEDLSLPDYTRGSHRALTDDEISLVIKCCNLTEAYMRLWVLLMLFCGLRRGEMIALDWSAINLNAHTLTVRQTAVIVGNKAVIEKRAKTTAGLRIIPIPNILFDMLRSVPAPKRSGFVCLSAHGKPLTESAVSRGLERFNAIATRYRDGEPITNPGRRTDLRPPANPVCIRAHDLRHTYCTMLYSAGVDVKTAAYLLGHSDVTVTMKIYTHLSESKKSASTRALAEYVDTHFDTQLQRHNDTQWTNK